MVKRALPRDETAFFGRTAELDEIGQRLGRGARLISLVGLPGIGKTRLALVAAADAPSVVYAHAPGPLEAGVREVARAAGVPLGAEHHASDALTTLGNALAKRGPLLLVLDDVASSDLVSGLLDHAAELAILATSREPLGVRGEQRIVVPPLGDHEAIALLRDRAATTVGSDIAIADDEARALVAKLDRLPLAIELAAARLEVLSPVQLLTRLEADLLANDRGDATGRSMRAALDGSWELLGDAERAVLAQASVFAAPFSVDAAEDVIAIGDGDGDVVGRLESLVRRSLVNRQFIGGEVRLVLFQTVRQWARGKLPDRQADAEVRHARVHLALAEAAAGEAYGERGVAALDALGAMLPELLSAFAATKTNHPALAARIVLALTDLLLFRSIFELRAELFDAAVAAAERASDDRLLARALATRARVTLEVGKMQDAEGELRRAIAIAEESGDEVTSAEATRSLGWALIALGRTEEAAAAIAAARRLHDAQGSARGIADTHVARGILCTFQDRSNETANELRAALAIHVAHGDVIRQEKVLGFAKLLGLDPSDVARGLPRSVLAQAPQSSALVLASMRGADDETAQRWQNAIDLYRRGAAAHERGDAAGAVALFERALESLGRTGVERGVAAIHAHAAVAFAELGDAREAAARLALARSSATDPASELAVSVFAASCDVLAGERIELARELLARATRAEIASSELAVATRVLARALEPAAATSPGADGATAALVVGPEARWIHPARGARVDLIRHGPVRRLLDHLVTARLESPGRALPAEELLEAGWPGERMLHSAGLLRVYSAIRRVRRMGLEALLITRDDGYLLDPEALILRR